MRRLRHAAALGIGAALLVVVPFAGAVPPNVTITAQPDNPTSSTSAQFSFSSTDPIAPTFDCKIDLGSFNPCTSPATFTVGDGSHTFTVQATNADLETSTASFTWTVDTTPPPAPTISGPSGTGNDATPTFTFTAAGASSFKCAIDAPTTPTAACSSPFTPAAALGDGAHTFYVTASDTAGNTSTVASQAFTIDATKPVLTGPGNLVAEADGPGGTRVSFIVSASDGTPPLALLPSAITCNPPSPTQFSLGRSTVTCTATDAVGNVGTTSFDVTVVDTTPPAINAPDASFTATSASGVSRSDPAVAAYLAGISATDLVSGVTLTTTTPEALPIGATKIVVTARDAAGNEAQKTVTLTVLEPGKTAPPPDFTPPGPAQRVVAKAGDHVVVLTWALPVHPDLASVRIERSVVGKPGTTTVYRGLGTTFKSTGLSNGVAYRFVLVVFDKAGNSSRPVVVSATPKALLLAAPKSGARVVKPPLLRWAPVASARYFNVQLYRKGTKILSAWPTSARLQLRPRWVYEKRAYTLGPGPYTWYVWPGLGARAEARYGELLGKSSFTVVLPKRV